MVWGPAGSGFRILGDTWLAVMVIRKPPNQYSSGGAKSRLERTTCIKSVLVII